MILGTLAVIVISVYYGHHYTTTGFPKDPVPLTLYALTIGLPFYLSLLRERSSSARRLYQTAADKVESECFKFRARCGAYTEDPYLTLQEKVKDIWHQTEAQTAKDKVRLPDDFWDIKDEDDDDAINETTKKVEDEPPPLVYDPVEDELSQFLAELPQSQRFSELSVEGRKALVRQKFNEHTPLLNNTTQEKEKEVMIVKVDDGLSPLSGRDYAKYRLEVMLYQRRKDVQAMERQIKVIQTLAKLITQSCAVAAFVSLQWVVPIIMGVATALHQILEATGYQTTLVSLQREVEQLDEILRWWLADGSSANIDEGKENEVTKNVLVEKTELIAVTNSVVSLAE
jgi:hypothetical protein